MFISNLKCYIEKLWEIIPKYQIHYYIYLDEYFVSFKKYSYHISKIFCPHGQNILVYVENIWLIWQEHSLKILCCSQKFNSCVCCSPFISSLLTLMCSHGSSVA